MKPSLKLLVRGFRWLSRKLTKRARLRRMAQAGVVFHPPNFIYRPAGMDEDSVVIDAGCASDPDFSKYLMARHRVTAWGVDPTLKHSESLALLEQETHGKFKYLPVAVAACPGSLTFHESLDNLSGSLLGDHTNILNDRIHSYEVQAVDLRGLLARTNLNTVDLLKLDLEGAEYELLTQVSSNDLSPFRQIFVEFHHHCLDRYNSADTLRIVQRLKAFGLRVSTFDDHNYLFFWQEPQ
jgi:FkbM family methyltransferase